MTNKTELCKIITLKQNTVVCLRLVLKAPVFQRDVSITLRRVVLRLRASRLSAELLKPPEEEDNSGQQKHLHCDEDEEADLRGQSQITQPVTTGLQQLLLGQIHEQTPPQVSRRTAADVPETHSQRITHTSGSTGNTGKDRLSLKHTARGSHTLQDRRETRVKTDYPWNTQPEDHTHSRIDGKHG